MPVVVEAPSSQPVEKKYIYVGHAFLRDFVDSRGAACDH